MKNQRQKQKTQAVTIRTKTYERLRTYLDRHPMAPPIVGLITTLVNEWLDKQEAADGD